MGDTPGIELEERLDVMPPHTVGQPPVAQRLQRARGPQAWGGRRRLPDRHGGARPVPADGRGGGARILARRAMDEASRRSIQRTAFKKPIAEHQMILGRASRHGRCPRGSAIRRRSTRRPGSTMSPWRLIARDAAFIAKTFSHRTGLPDHRPGGANLRRSRRDERHAGRTFVSARPLVFRIFE